MSRPATPITTATSSSTSSICVYAGRGTTAPSPNSADGAELVK
jgi:hypothetical protein